MYMAEDVVFGPPDFGRPVAAWHQPRLSGAGDRRSVDIFAVAPDEGETDADMARRHTDVFLRVIEGEGFAEPSPRPMFPNTPGLPRLENLYSAGLRERIWWV